MDVRAVRLLMERLLRECHAQPSETEDTSAASAQQELICPVSTTDFVRTDSCHLGPFQELSP